MKWRLLFLCGIVATSGCGPNEGARSGSFEAARDSAVSNPELAALPSDAIKILFLGNSHTAYNDLSGMVRSFAREGFGKQVYTRVITGGFLNDIAGQTATRAAFSETKWSFVVLQGALLSSSHSREYPNPGILELTKLAKKNGARPLFFVEWPRRDWDESAFQYESYAKFAKQAKGGELVPICWAWDKARKGRPGLDLWADDGNHADPAGSYLAATTIAYWMCGTAKPLRWQPTQVEPSLAGYLREVARKTVADRRSLQKP